MKTLSTVHKRPAQTSRNNDIATEKGFPISSAGFDWLMTGISGWIVAGTYLDGWYHNTFAGAIETFFTPWHAVLYSGILTAGIALISLYYHNRTRGFSRLRALPKGYFLSLLGFILFVFGGNFDFLWHEMFGFETDTEALLSPAHLLLATGGVLLISGPLRASRRRLQRENRSGFVHQLPIILSLLFIFSIFTFFTQFANLYPHPSVLRENAPLTDHDKYFRDVTILSYVLLPAGLTMAFTLIAVLLYKLPVGSLSLIITANALLMFSLGTGRGEAGYWLVLLGGLVGGVMADLLLAWLKPTVERITQLRIFAFTVPFVSALSYFAVLLFTGGIWWGIHMWLGAPFLAGVTGLGLASLVNLNSMRWDFE